VQQVEAQAEALEAQEVHLAVHLAETEAITEQEKSPKKKAKAAASSLGLRKTKRRNHLPVIVFSSTWRTRNEKKNELARLL
jgi:UDP-glucose 4-epimerase